MKYIYDARSKKEEIYDVDRDPHDQHDIFPTTDWKVIQDLRAACAVCSVHPGT